MSVQIHYFPASLEVVLATIPSLPRPVLSQLVQQMIERLDDIDGDSDFEDCDVDRCPSHDDDPISAATRVGLMGYECGLVSDHEDAEDGYDDEFNEQSAYAGPVTFNA